MMQRIEHVFVYGTLQRGQVRDNAWPCKPRAVKSAVVLGYLYDLGDYPALTPGSDRVRGELWQFAYEQMDPTLVVLDMIEGYADGAEDLHRRVEVTCQCGSQVISAFSYHYARPLEPEWRIPARDGFCSWP